MTDEIERYLEFAKQLALDSGGIMKSYFEAGVEREWKTDSTPVTKADKEINSLVIKRIGGAYPDHSVLGEEESSNLGNQYTWVCDPVDGTMPFSHGLPISSFSLALTKDGVPILGVVYDPFSNRLFSATQGQGAYLGNNRLHVSKNDFTNSLIDLEGFPSVKPVVDCGAEVKDMVTSTGAKVICLWSAVLPSALVASGIFTAVVLNTNQPQDSAAIKVIVEEAGGKVTDLYGKEQRYDQPTKGFVASNGIIHNELIKIIREASDEI